MGVMNSVPGSTLRLAVTFDRMAFVSLTAMCVLIPVESLTPLVAGRTYAWILGVVASVACISSALMRRRLPRVDWRLLLAATAWLVLGAASMLWATDVGVALTRVQILAQGMVFFFLVPAVLFSQKCFLWLVWLYVVSASVVSVSAVVLAYVLDLQRVALSDAQSPIHLGQSLGIALVMVTFLAARRSSVKRGVMLFFCANVISLAVLLTGSRGAWLGLCGAGIGTIILTKGRGLNWRRVLVPTLAIGLQLFLVVHLGGLPSGDWARQRAETFLNPLSVEGSSGRLGIWHVGWEMVLDNPIIGIGLQNFPVRFADYIEPAGLEGGYGIYPGRDPHSVYLSILAELGIVGLTVVVFFVLLILRRGYSVWKQQGSSLGLLLALLPLGYGIACTITYRKYFWFALALAATITLYDGSQDEGSSHLA